MAFTAYTVTRRILSRRVIRPCARYDTIAASASQLRQQRGFSNNLRIRQQRQQRQHQRQHQRQQYVAPTPQFMNKTQADFHTLSLYYKSNNSDTTQNISPLLYPRKLDSKLSGTQNSTVCMCQATGVGTDKLRRRSRRHVVQKCQCSCRSSNVSISSVFRHYRLYMHSIPIFPYQNSRNMYSLRAISTSLPRQNQSLLNSVFDRRFLVTSTSQSKQQVSRIKAAVDQILRTRQLSSAPRLPSNNNDATDTGSPAASTAAAAAAAAAAATSTQVWQPRGVIPSEMTSRAVIRALIGNCLVASLKFWAFFATRSSSMLAEAIHSAVDAANQLLLLMGVLDARRLPDARHPLGYSRSVFFYSLVSALGIFWLGCGVTCVHAIHTLLHPPESLDITWHVWAVLAGSFMVDGVVLRRALSDLRRVKPANMSLFAHIRSLTDPIMMAAVLEDVAATLGIVIAMGGIALSQITGNVMYDALASLFVGGLMGAVALTLVKMNYKFLLGASVESATSKHITHMLMQRESIDAIYSVHTVWVGPNKFAYRASIDFNGHYFAQKLRAQYRDEFLATDESGVDHVMSRYAEAVTHLVEAEVREIEAMIRAKHPEAVYIDLEPASPPLKNE
jgi:cation diffusion facilitator family transporter